MSTGSALTGQVAIVTGGSKGYGAGIAQRLREAGATVWITGRDEAALRATADRLGVNSCCADVTKGADWDRLFEQAWSAHGRIDILVNNAGAGIRIAPTDRQTDEAIEQSIAVNLTGPLLGCRRAAPVMKRQGAGIIINISSVCARYAWPGWGPYSAAKAGLNQFAHCLYTELRKSGVRVTTITPSWGATEFGTAAQIANMPTDDPAVRSKCMQPLELGDLVVHLASMPSHLDVPDITVQPLVQEIVPL